MSISLDNLAHRDILARLGHPFWYIGGKRWTRLTDKIESLVDIYARFGRKRQKWQ